MKKIFLFVFILISFLSFVISDDLVEYNEEELIELLINSDFSSNEIKNLIRDLTPHDLNILSEENVQRVSEDVAKLYFENKLPKKIDNSNELILFEKMTGTKLLDFDNLIGRGAEFEIKEEMDGFIFEQKISGSIVSVLINDQISEIKLTELGIEIGDILFKQGEFYNFNFNNYGLEFESNSLFEIEFDNSRLVGDLKGNNEKFFFGEQHANIEEYYFYQTQHELSIKSNIGFHHLYLDESFDLGLNFVVNDDARINVYGDDINEPLIVIDENFNSRRTLFPWSMRIEVGGNYFFMIKEENYSILQINPIMNNEEEIKNHFSKLAELQKKINGGDYTAEDVTNRERILNELISLGVEPRSILPSGYRNYEEYWLALSLGEENFVINQAMISTRSESEISQINRQDDEIAQLYSELAELQFRINQGDLYLEEKRNELIEELMRRGQKDVYDKGDNKDLTYEQLWNLRSEQFSNGNFDSQSNAVSKREEIIREQIIAGFNSNVVDIVRRDLDEGKETDLCAAYVAEVLKFFYGTSAQNLNNVNAWEFKDHLDIKKEVNGEISLVRSYAEPGDVLAIYNENSRYNDRGDFTHVATYLGDGMISHLIGDREIVESLEEFNNRQNMNILSVLSVPKFWYDLRVETTIPYQIQSGDTLNQIIRSYNPNLRPNTYEYNLLVDQIKELNRIENIDHILLNDIILLPEINRDFVGEVIYADVDTSSKYVNSDTFKLPEKVVLTTKNLLGRYSTTEREVPDEIRSAIKSVSEGDPLMEATLINIWIQETQYGGKREFAEQLIMNPDLFNQEISGSFAAPALVVPGGPLAYLLMRGVSNVKDRILENYDYDIKLPFEIPFVGDQITANSYGITQVNLDLVVRMYDDIDTRAEAIHFLTRLSQFSL